MATTETVPVNIVKNGQVVSKGEVTRTRWSKGDRVFRGARVGAVCFGLAVFSVLVPILHFVLVPGFLLLGVLMFLSFYGQEEGYTGGKGVCPECHKEFEIVAGRKLPFNDLCNHCRAHFEISLP